MKNQLFSTVPDFEITTELLNYFGIQGFEDNHSFTKDNLQSLETVDKIVKIIDKLEEYYLPCKHSYIKELNEKKCITILRQFLKIHGYTLFSKEKYVRGRKALHYQVIPLQVTMNTGKPPHKSVMISFD